MKQSKIVILFTLFPLIITAQRSETNQNYYQQGLTALGKGDTFKAIDFLKDAGKKENNAEAYFKLAEIYSQTKTHTQLTKALQSVRKATELDKKNIKYRLLMAKTREELFYAHILNLEERSAAIKDYEKILEMDSTCTEANIQLGRLKQEDFLEFNRSEMLDLISNIDTNSHVLLRSIQRIGLKYKGSIIGRQAKDEFDLAAGNSLKYEEYSEKDFIEAEKYLLQAIHYEPTNKESYFLLSKLYLESSFTEKGIKILEQLRQREPLDKNVNFYLGLFNYRLRRNAEADKYFKKALALMSYDEKQLFVYNTVKIFLEPELGDKLETISRDELDSKIKKMWLIQDPLLLTEYNERLLEHFARVGYANLFFGVDELNLEGWQTDRGEIFIRYGQPWKVKRTRPNIIRSAYVPKGELWTYPDKQFAFDDTYLNGNYRFNKRGRMGNIISSFQTDTDDFIHYYREELPQEYIPNMEGPIFDINYKTYQFQSIDKNKTQIFLSYLIAFDSLLAPKESFSDGYEIGLFFHDIFMNRQLDKKVVRPAVVRDNEIVSIDCTLLPETGNLAFEIRRNKDLGVASYHGQFKVNNYLTNKLLLSDIVLSYDISEENQCSVCMKRDKIDIYPNPSGSFRKGENFYLYYEVYNLIKGKDNLTDFEQKITIQKKEKDNALKDVLDIVGLGNKGEKISTTSHYQTLEADPRIYFQLDLSKYESGNYIVTITIIDKLSQSEVNVSTDLFLTE